MTETFELRLPGAVPLRLIAVPAGAFVMGSPENEAGHEPEEVAHRVILSREFYLGRAPVTRRQWAALMGGSPPDSSAADEPMTAVSWHDAQRFIARLAERHPSGVFRLPTEAEWEYACRAGTSTPFAGGDSEADLARLAWYAGNSGGAPHPVATKAPNAWGLHDMHGNVFEWCQDWEGPYPAKDATDPVGPPAGEKRVLRGGCFKCPAPYCRSANRYAAPPDRQAPNFGFRVVWSPSAEGDHAER